VSRVLLAHGSGVDGSRALVRRRSELSALSLAASCTAVLVSELCPAAVPVLIKFQSKLNTTIYMVPIGFQM
jgi:hypothetical protein